ncbi:MAG: lysostaphin resistance A-like protein, partial [Methanobacteriaceae archaeon]
KFLNKRKGMSFINTIESYDINGKTISWFKRFRWDRFLKGILIWGIFLIIMQIIKYIMYPTAYVINNEINIPLLIFLLVVALFVQVSLEELFFRGYLNQLISLKVNKPIIVIIISSLIFALPHVLNASGLENIIMYLIATFFIGMILSVVVLYDNGLEMAIGIHFINNFISFCLPITNNNVGNANSLFIAMPDPISMQILALLGMVVFSAIMFIYKKERILKALEIEGTSN